MKPEIIQLMVEDHDNFIHIITDRASGEAAIVDPAWDSEGIQEILAEEKLTLTAILLTHSHYDHVNAVLPLYTDKVSLFIGENEYPHWSECPEDAILVSEGDEIQFAKTTISVISTPGHTAGGVCYRIDDNLMTGDTLFIYGCGRADLPGGDAKKLYHSLQKLKKLPPQTKLWVGHHYGITEESTLAEQLTGNPFLLIENEEDFVRYRNILASKTRQMPYEPITKEALNQVLKSA
ncbi:MBL fold metallo-hydrolase [Suttonella ornithocola]|uniref:Probable polyketide biosynthesis zinc-dependent hydrolase BaeB n=1 Tax=Suttonella ornithocola TaxID=279832 RepID=A0A380N0Q7_9GAMM|nr:MBL fold metallo-hydrolase [Suttonella ornithocola]SUO97703.1 Probable polyketide biosynthesis zinc-dependent hydrolase BaeB [Suttonella ornithocola]